jgi:hypothetical protein
MYETILVGVSMFTFRKAQFNSSFQKRLLTTWHDLRAQLPVMEKGKLAELQASLDKQSRHLNELQCALSARLSGEGPAPARMPVLGDWAHRPDPWARLLAPTGLAGPDNGAWLCPGSKLFHDCNAGQIMLRQQQTGRADHPFAVLMEVMEFSGSFLSLVFDMPKQGAKGLSEAHVFQLYLNVTLERPLEVFARVNLRHGPNVAQVVREVMLDTGEHTVEFDISSSTLRAEKVDGLWLDLIFDEPAMSAVLFHDLTVARRPRAEV